MEKPQHEDATANWEGEGGSVLPASDDEEASHPPAPSPAGAQRVIDVDPPAVAEAAAAEGRESLLQSGTWVNVPRFRARKVLN